MKALMLILLVLLLSSCGTSSKCQPCTMTLSRDSIVVVLADGRRISEPQNQKRIAKHVYAPENKVFLKFVAY